VAVGGIRTAADVAAARAAGAHGIQVHRAYAEHGRACLAPLLAGFAAGS
jgi:dihydroorotate dehydrogenase